MASARDWILVLFGRFVRDQDGWIPIGQLIDLLGPLGADAASTRTAVSRMKRAGTIEAVSRGRIAGYQLTSAGRAFFADGDRRVFDRPDENSRWVLASFSVPESKRSLRYRVRARLLELGFGQESAGLLIAPAGLAGEAERTLRGEGLEPWVSLWLADFGSLGSISDVVRRSWDTEAIAARYETYIKAADVAVASAGGDDEQTFGRYASLVNDWRELRYLDPGLPAAVLGERWPEPRARSRFDQVEATLAPIAQRHYDAVTSQTRSVAA